MMAGQDGTFHFILIDIRHGLNVLVIALTRVPPRKESVMCHDRTTSLLTKDLSLRQSASTTSISGSNSPNISSEYYRNKSYLPGPAFEPLEKIQVRIHL